MSLPEMYVEGKSVVYFLLFIYLGFGLSARSERSKARLKDVCSPGGFDCLFENSWSSSFTGQSQSVRGVLQKMSHIIHSF